jgi:hypothetical protein
MRVLKKSLGFILPVMVMAIFLTIPIQVQASPLFSLDTLEDWELAPINPVLSPHPSANEFYGTEGTDFLYVPPDPPLGDLYVWEGDGSEATPDAGLVMTWGDPAADPDIPQLAAWEYVYPEDPNLIGTTLKLTVTPPAGIYAVSLALNDAALGWNAWDWWVATPGNPLPLNPGAVPLAPGVPTVITINPVVNANQSGSNIFATSPVFGFNPAIATTIQADELAAGPGGWATFPAVPVVGGQQPWNYWSSMSVTVVPEPISSILFVTGGATLGFMRFRKKFKK